MCKKEQQDRYLEPVVRVKVALVKPRETGSQVRRDLLPGNACDFGNFWNFNTCHGDGTSGAEFIFGNFASRISLKPMFGSSATCNFKIIRSSRCDQDVAVSIIALYSRGVRRAHAQALKSIRHRGKMDYR